MLSEASIQAFQTLASGIERRALAQLPFRFKEVSDEQKRQSGATTYCSRWIFDFDDAAAQHFTTAAEECLNTAMNANRTEPSGDSSAREQQLQGLLSDRIAALGKGVRAQLEERQAPLVKYAGNPKMIEASTRRTDAAIEDSLQDLPARLRQDILMAANARTESGAVHLGNYNFIGSVQTGANSTANVVQTVNQEQPHALIAELDRLIEVLRESAHAEAPGAVGALIEVKAEASKPAPDRYRMMDLLGGVAGTVSAIADAPAVYAAAMAAWSLWKASGG